MEELRWRFGVVGNITEYHIGDDGKQYRGTKPFTPGTKVYLGGKNWSRSLNTIGVIGRNRFGRMALEWIDFDCIENIRTQRIYNPCVLEMISRQECWEGWKWWNRTAADRNETKKFVDDWKSNQTNEKNTTKKER